MVAIPQSGLLAQVSFLRLPSGHSGLVLTLSNAAHASLPSPGLLVADAGICEASPLGSYHWARNLWGLIIYLFSPLLCCPLRFQGSPQTRQWECFLVFGNLSFLRLPSWDGSPSLPLLSLYLLYFFLPPFKDNGLPFWVPDVLCQHSEVVLWNLLSVQMFFQWICGGESGLPVLVLHHLRTAPDKYCITHTWNLKYNTNECINKTETDS